MKIQILKSLIENIQKNESITIEKLVELSGIKNQPNFDAFDYTVPIDRHGNYPHGGNAISVYYNGIVPEIVSYRKLTIMALNQIYNQVPDIDEWNMIHDINEYRLYVNYVKLISSVEL